MQGHNSHDEIHDASDGNKCRPGTLFALVGSWRMMRFAFEKYLHHEEKLLRLLLHDCPILSHCGRGALWGVMQFPNQDQGAGCWGKRSTSRTGTMTTRAVAPSAHNAALACACSPSCCQAVTRRNLPQRATA